MDLWTLTFGGWLGLFLMQPPVEYVGNALVAETPGFYSASGTLASTTVSTRTCAAKITSLSLPGASTGDACITGASSLGPGTNLSTGCFVNATGTVDGVYCNMSTAAQNLGPAFDSTAANSANAGSGASPIDITVDTIAGETGFVYVVLAASSLTGVAVTSVTGGGTWTLVGAQNASATIRTELWTNGAGGGTTAGAVVVNFSGTVTVAWASVDQYLGVRSILTGGTETNSGTTSTPATVSLTLANSNDWVVAALGILQPGSTATAVSGNLRISGGSANGYILAMDNTASSGSVTVSGYLPGGTMTDWSAVAVEIEGNGPLEFAVLDGTTVSVAYASSALTTASTAANEVSNTTSSFASDSIPANTCTCEGTVTVTGAAVGNVCTVGPPSGGAGTDIGPYCYVSAANTVEACFCNYHTSSETVSTGTWTYKVLQPATTASRAVTYTGNALSTATGTPTVISTTTTFSGTAAASACTAQTALTGVTGAATGNACVVGPPSGGFGTDLTAFCYVNASNDITPVFCNASASAQTKETGTWTFGVVQ